MNTRRLSWIFVILLVASLATGRISGAGFITFLLTLATIAVGLILGVRGLGAAIRRAIWRLRNRLIVTYIFLAVIPVVLFVVLGAVGMWIVAGQTAVHLTTTSLDRFTYSLDPAARILSRSAASEQKALLNHIGREVSSAAPDAEIVVAGADVLHYPSTSTLSVPTGAWKDYNGYVLKDGRFFSASINGSGASKVAILAPIDGDLMENAIGAVGLIDFPAAENRMKRSYVAGRLPAQLNAVDFQIWWYGRLPYVAWEETGKVHDGALFVVQTRPSAALRALFGNRTDEAQVTLVLFAVVASLLLIVEIVALVVGVSLSGTITRAVHGLYAATTSVAKGDFSHRIPVNGQDQLAALGNSFNEMTARIESLVVVAKEKERLQSEIEIASGVQNQLFPRKPPKLRSIEVTGQCQAARMVSGDYFDYLSLDGGVLAIALGDVAGKGISAALLMASIQSIVRSRLTTADPAGISPAEVVARLNSQLYASTSAEKFATLFFGLYDEASRTLRYTNAGHLQPLILRADACEMLDVTGTVVGAFPSIAYGEKSVRIEPGDILIAYTDGVTEPENAYGEEYGLERLTETAKRNRHLEPPEMAAKIVESVMQWSSAPEMPDDMTVVMAKGLAG